MTQWLLLHYKLPPEPSALRVYVWRKLKRLGAVLFQDAVWLLPLTPRTQEQFRWLAAEFIFIPAGQKPFPEGAEPIDIPGVRYSHHRGHCTFYALLKEFKLKEPILAHRSDRG